MNVRWNQLTELADAIDARDQEMSEENQSDKGVWNKAMAYGVASVSSLLAGWFGAHLTEGHPTADIERVGTLGVVVLVVLIFTRDRRSDRDARDRKDAELERVISQNTLMLGRTIEISDHQISISEKLERLMSRQLDIQEAAGVLVRPRKDMNPPTDECDVQI